MDFDVAKMKCVPDGWCSSNYRIRTGDREGKVSFSNISPCGAINDGYKDYSVELAGKIKRRWELRDENRVVLSASKSLGLKRVIKIKKGAEVYTLLREPGGSCMTLEGRSNSACYKPLHPLTKRHRITGQWSDDCLVIFGFWFVAYYEQIDAGLAVVISGAVDAVT